MSALRESLARLEQVVSKLEGSLGGLEKTMKGKQRDMFGAPISASNGNSAKSKKTYDGVLVSKKLDSTIARVEKLLREG